MYFEAIILMLSGNIILCFQRQTLIQMHKASLNTNLDVDEMTSIFLFFNKMMVHLFSLITPK
jgi:hypothetical protein